MLVKRHEFTSKDLGKILNVQYNMDRSLSSWESNHKEYSHTFDMYIGENSFNLVLEIHEEFTIPTNN